MAEGVMRQSFRVAGHSAEPAPMRWLICAATAAFIIKIFIAFYTVGTNDSLTWDHDLAKLRTGGFTQLYREGVQYSSPSGWMYPRQDFVHPPAVVSGFRG